MRRTVNSLSQSRITVEESVDCRIFFDLNPLISNFYLVF